MSLSQDHETALKAERNRSLLWRYAYARSSESIATGDTGQDYLALRHDDHVLAFALCDGVGQSFFGEIAARYLGDALIDWLWDDVGTDIGPVDIQAALSARLRWLTRGGTELVRAEKIPPDVPPMLAEVLEDKRKMGSETSFVCGKIVPASPDLPDGRVVLAWLGDSRIRLWGDGQERTSELGGSFETYQRWSTARGALESEPHVFVASIAENGSTRITQIMIYSDGLSSLDSLDRRPSSADIVRLMEEEAEAPHSDDISILDVWLGELPDNTGSA